MSKCDFAMPQRTINDEDFSRPDDEFVSFNTINGESVGVYDYNPTCDGESNADFMTSGNAGNMVCASFIYDLNGISKGPNKVGKDIGLIVAYFPEYPLVVAPMPVAATTNEVGADEMEDFLASNPEYRLPSPAEVVALSRYGLLMGAEYHTSSIWTDNNVICDQDSCNKATSAKSKQTFNLDNLTKNTEKSMTKAGASAAHLVLVSKNGDAPKTFKTLEDVKACDKEDKPDCKTGDKAVCDNSTGKWSCVHQ